jgi:nucleoside-diphosphate-sugar epimerase
MSLQPQNVLVTGNNGYIGTVLTKQLQDAGYNITGLDTQYFNDCRLGSSSNNIRQGKFKQIKKDIRKVTIGDLKRIDTVIHLAALSNEHLCNINPRLAFAINFKATARLANLSKKTGVKHFIFSSSQNVYDGLSGRVDEKTGLIPGTAYGKSKLLAEHALLALNDKNFSVTILRPGAVYGVSLMQRLDVIINNLTAWAFTTDKIRIMSNGQGYRSNIHIKDLAQAIVCIMQVPLILVKDQIFNVAELQSYKIIEIAQIINEVYPQAKIHFTHEFDYKTIQHVVKSDKFHRVLKDYYHPVWNIKKGVNQLISTFRKYHLTKEQFNGNTFIRENHFKYLLTNKIIDNNYYWFL